MVGETKDAGWQIGVSRTLPYPPERVWRLLTEDPSVWLGPGARLGTERGAAFATDDGGAGETRGYREMDRVRVTWRPAGGERETTVQFTVRASADGGTAVRFHQERLAGPEERERRREYWRGVLDRVEAELAGE